MAKGFVKGQSGNPAGRPPKAINKIARPVKESIADFLNEKFAELPRIWPNLKPMEQARLIVDLMPYVVPKLQATTLDGNINFSGMSEAEIDAIAIKLYNHEKNGSK